MSSGETALAMPFACLPSCLEDLRGNTVWNPSKLEDTSMYWWRMGNDGEIETTFQEPAVTERRLGNDGKVKTTSQEPAVKRDEEQPRQVTVKRDEEQPCRVTAKVKHDQDQKVKHEEDQNGGHNKRRTTTLGAGQATECPPPKARKKRRAWSREEEDSLKKIITSAPPSSVWASDVAAKLGRSRASVRKKWLVLRRQQAESDGTDVPLPCGQLHDDAIQAGTMVQRLVPKVMLTAARARPYQASLPPSGMCKLVAPAPTTALDAYAEEDVAAAAPVAVATTRGEGEGWKERHDTLMLRIEELEKERMNRSAGTGWAMVSVQDGLIKKSWSAREEAQLVEIMRKDGTVAMDPSWASIVAAKLGRTHASVRRKWLRLRHTIDAPNASLEGNGGE